MSGASHQRISLCMILKDEERVIGRCLQSVRPLVDEIIAVDTGSSDRTASLAERFGARVYHHPWQNDFSLHRNQSLSYATGDWILVMDADEVIAARDLERIRALTETTRADGILFTLRNYVEDTGIADLSPNPGDYEEGAAFPGFIGCDLVRLFRSDPRTRFAGQVHETVTQSLLAARKTIIHCGIPIHHYGKTGESSAKEKKEFYLALGLKRLEEHPRDPIAYKGVADQYLELGLPQRALEVAARGLAVFPGRTDLLFIRGVALDRLGRPAEAQADYVKVLAGKPDHAGACHNLAQLYASAGQLKDALSVLDSALGRGLRHPAVFMVCGQILSRIGELKPALDFFAQAERLQPDLPGLRIHKAVALLNQGSFSAAIDCLEREIAAGGDLPSAYNLLGELSLVQNDPGSALTFFKRVLSLDPRNEQATDNLKRMPQSSSPS